MRGDPVIRFSSPLLPALALLLTAATSQSEEAPKEKMDSRVELGSRLFRELNFTNQAADYGSSCAGCHATGNQVKGRNERHYADYPARSMTALKVLTTRNTPTLLDVVEMERLGWAGDYTSLEGLVLDKLLGAVNGWKPSDRERAIDAIHFTLLEEGAGGAANAKSYAQHFAEAYDVEAESMSSEGLVELGARAIADFVRSIRTTETAPWDAFVAQNRFHKGPNPAETPEHYSFGVFSRVGNQEGRMLIKRPKGFTRAAYQGFKTFLRTEAQEEGQAVGKCVLCHVPPKLTDFQFHNTGIAEMEYEALHGDGSSTNVKPERPSDSTRAVPSKEQPAHIDLGYWNQAPSEEAARGAFKTPTLRNISRTDPYMHNGAYATLEDAVRAKVRISQRAREGRLPSIDPIYHGMVLTDEDIAPLVAFLEQLNEVGRADFRQYLIELADD